MATLRDINQFTPTEEDLEVLVDFQAIFQGVSNVINTKKRERLFNLDFGIELEEELFETIDDATSFDLLRIISNAIAQFEPRVILLAGQSSVTPDPTNNRFLIDLAFEPVGAQGQVLNLKGSLTL